jgi:hypothetical protein
MNTILDGVIESLAPNKLYFLYQKLKSPISVIGVAKIGRC